MQDGVVIEPADTTARHKAGRSYQQVVLVTGEMLTENERGLRYVVLERGPAQQVGSVLSWLYPPAGPAGSRNRYSLLYPSVVEADAAAAAVADLDVLPAQEDRTEPAVPVGNRAFTLGLGLLYRGAAGDVLNKERMRRVEGMLARAAADAKLPPARRWAAARIAARISADQLGDFEAAKRHLAVAETLSEAGSLEKMVTWLARADACAQNGEPKSAERLLGQILTGFPTLQDTEAFERAKQAKAELDRNR